MTPTAIIEDLDEVEHNKARCAVVGEDAAIDELAFQCGEEAFGHSVVIAVAYGAHGGGDAGISQAATEGERSVLRSLVRVVDQTRLRTSPLDRRLECFGDQLGGKIWPHRPADYGAAEYV